MVATLASIRIKRTFLAHSVQDNPGCLRRRRDPHSERDVSLRILTVRETLYIYKYIYIYIYIDFTLRSTCGRALVRTWSSWFTAIRSAWTRRAVN